MQMVAGTALAKNTVLSLAGQVSKSLVDIQRDTRSTVASVDVLRINNVQDHLIRFLVRRLVRV
jgi:hypothetical protein